MPITFAQAQQLSQPKLTKKVIDQFRTSALIDALPFDNTVKPAGGNSRRNHGGQGAGYADCKDLHAGRTQRDHRQAA